MKKVLFGLATILGVSALNCNIVTAKCYEPMYLATKCDDTGYDNCVNYRCDEVVEVQGS